MEQKITVGTLARTIILALALINQCLVMDGVSTIPILEEQVEILVSTGATVVTAVIAWWKNNNFKKAAKAGDQAMREER